jgi:hypothetical protein
LEHGLVGALDGNYTFFDYYKGSGTIGVAINKDGVVAGSAFSAGERVLSFHFSGIPMER